MNDLMLLKLLKECLIIQKEMYYLFRFYVLYPKHPSNEQTLFISHFSHISTESASTVRTGNMHVCTHPFYLLHDEKQCSAART